MSLSMQGEKYDTIVIGGGAHGLSTAYHLAKQDIKVALLQRYALGHVNGSSHSQTRIIRSTYPSKFYHDLAVMAMTQSWPEMEKELGCKLVYQNTYIKVEQTAEYQSYAQVVRSDNKDTQYFSTMQEIKKTYPSFPFMNCKNHPIVDTSGGVVAAQTYLRKLEDKLKQMPNLSIYQHMIVKEVRSNEQEVVVQTQTQSLIASKVIVACGRWLSQLLPEMKPLIRPVKQVVAFLEMKRPKQYRVGKYPCWSSRDQKYGNYYSLPNLQGDLVKIAHHFTEESPTENDIKARIMKMNDKIVDLFGKNLKRIKYYQNCYYTMTKTEDFIIDWCDSEERVLVVSACSGHGFKFAPLIGKIAAQISQEDQTIPLVEKNRHLFRIPYHFGMNLQE